MKNVRWGGALFLLMLLFVAWRMIRPLNIFVVSDQFARPMAITTPPAGLDSLAAAECGVCHQEVYKEWATSIHSQAWTDPYYQVDYAFDGSQAICLNCHTPLQNQQENLVLGFKDKERFKPILKKNTNFDYDLQQEGVTCVVCHLRDGVIIGPYKDVDAPHPTRFAPVMVDGFGVCKKCHMVVGKRWDTFFKIPPCGTVAEIRADNPNANIDCTACHMPKLIRGVARGKSRPGRAHLFRGGHDQDTVRRAVQVDVSINDKKKQVRRVAVTLTNIGAAHFLPTGTPDRHLSVTFTLRDIAGNIIKGKTYKLKRTILWRPFIVDLWDNRLIRGKHKGFDFAWNNNDSRNPTSLTVTVRYHLLGEKRRKRIGYVNTEPISYPIYKKLIDLI